MFSDKKKTVRNKKDLQEASESQEEVTLELS